MLEPTPEQSIRRLKTGSLLVAREVLKDANFDGTVLLLCAHREDGDYGLILNRSSYMPLTEIFESLPPHMRGPRRVCVGGPVEQEKVQILDWSGDPAPEAQQVVSGLFMGGHWDFSWKDEELPEGLRALGKSFVQTDPANYRIFIGYAGWEPEQLRSEIELGAWGVYDADIVAALEMAPEHLPQGEKAFAEWAARHPRKH